MLLIYSGLGVHVIYQGVHIYTHMGSSCALKIITIINNKAI